MPGRAGRAAAALLSLRSVPLAASPSSPEDRSTPLESCPPVAGTHTKQVGESRSNTRWCLPACRPPRMRLHSGNRGSAPAQGPFARFHFQSPRSLQAAYAERQSAADCCRVAVRLATRKAAARRSHRRAAPGPDRFRRGSHSSRKSRPARSGVSSRRQRDCPSAG